MRILSFGILFICSLLANILPEEEHLSPWLTGPLIAPMGKVVPYGDFVLKSYVYGGVETGRYNENWKAVSSENDFYSFKIEFLAFLGLTSWCDLNVIPQVFYQTTSNQHYGYPGDLTVGLDFQLMEEDFTPYFPGIKFAVREVFPTGNFEFFHPRKLGADRTGGGSFSTQFDLVLYKVFHLGGKHWLSTTLSGEYMIQTPVNVHGFNTYGGGFGTRGTALPGNRFQGILSFELTLNQNWVLAFDTIYTQTDATQFFGLPGITYYGRYATVGTPSSEAFQLAPAIEYNWSPHLGVIGGCWFSVMGRNSAQFQSGVINFQYTY